MEDLQFCVFSYVLALFASFKYKIAIKHASTWHPFMLPFNHGLQNVSFQVYSGLAVVLLPITLRNWKDWFHFLLACKLFFNVESVSHSVCISSRIMLAISTWIIIELKQAVQPKVSSWESYVYCVWIFQKDWTRQNSSASEHKVGENLCSSGYTAAQLASAVSHCTWDLVLSVL